VTTDARSAAAAEPPAEVAAESLLLAIVDDHELVREGLCALVETNAQGAIRIVYSGAVVSEAVAAQPTVVLLDVELGPGSADVGTNTAVCHAAGIPVLLISAYDEPAAIRSGMRAGALGFVPKRVSYGQLTEALASVAADELYLSVDLAAMLASASETPDLSPRELDALRLYASGLKLAAVAHRMGISPHTAKEYLDRVRAKYQHVGRPARTRTELYAAASRDGLLPADPPGR
jgi:two-component system, NarL family, nitrate/nitrite response regulator NarL